jgi:hypothetical protein
MFPVSDLGDLLRRFRAPSALCGILLACVSPLSAQSFSHIRLVTLPAAAPFVPLSGQGSLRTGSTALFALSTMAQHKSELWEEPRDFSEFKRGLGEIVEFSGTPFTQQVRMPLGSLFGGRIRLGGFNAVIPMEHIQRGLPGGGSLDAWSSVPMGHAGMILPKDDNQYGLCLTFHLAGSTDEARIAKWNGLVSWLADRDSW